MRCDEIGIGDVCVVIGNEDGVILRAEAMLQRQFQRGASGALRTVVHHAAHVVLWCVKLLFLCVVVVVVEEGGGVVEGVHDEE